MANMNEKLNTFSSLVMRDVSQKRDNLVDNMKKKHDEIMAQKEEEYREESMAQIQQKLVEVQKKENQQVLQAELDARKQLLLYRDEIINDVMRAVEDKLKTFMNSPEYKQWLIGRIERAVLEVGKGRKVVYVFGDDLKLKEEIEKLSMNAEITVKAADEKDFLGGAKVYNTDRRVSVDYSFKEMLAEEKKSFLQSSGLTIE